MDLSGSDGTRKCLNDSQLPDSRFQLDVRDPFLLTITTSRQTQEERLCRLLKPGLLESNNRRGFAHTQEYRNFSHFNAVLKSNENASLNR